MAGSRLIAYLAPPMPFECDSGVFPARPPQMLLWDLSSFRLWTFFRVWSENDYPDTINRVHTVKVLRSPLLEFGSLKHIQPEDFVGTYDASHVKNGSRVWLPSWRSSSCQPIKPCFMLKALMGFPSQSLLPDLKPQLLIGLLLLPCPLATDPRTVQWRTGVDLRPWLRSLVP
jgi:hypothetical protein